MTTDMDLVRAVLEGKRVPGREFPPSSIFQPSTKANARKEERMDEIVRHTPELRGEESDLFPGNAEIVILRDDPEAGTTLLARLPAGGKVEAHSHFGPVQHFVLSGQCESHGSVFKAGTYRLLPSEADVAPITSRDGAVILIIYDPVRSFSRRY